MIWLNGRLHQGTTVPFDVTDRGLLLADGLFETIAVFGGRPFRLADHLDRLLRGAGVIGLPVEPARLNEAVAALAPHAAEGLGVLRLTVTRGAGPRGLAAPAQALPTVLATLASWSPSLVMRPVRLATSRIRRNAASPSSRLKTLAYLDNVLGLEEARRAGADDALFLDTAGLVACASAANIFALFGGRLVTPRVDGAVLPGITRAVVLATAADLGLDAEECPLTPAELAEADAVFLTNSARLVCPVTAIDGRQMPAGDAVARKVLARLEALVRDECGVALPIPDLPCA
ncbi:aminotransferase class IV [Chelatococcus sp. SYSU_G07232]|uniref:Probable branched-chain-amino-acid aminotransferase n=1 Tax=Chelatococcus albus TaxID=3047466 RepID=A0ABT7AG27_9HYPH|nr:aminotransferase class IV [Chelatococcus sp. SYSU_G07232]MDJ1157972.1 aminotransferase class IV [Chelatococcus sp. SYSU_G07232]